MITDDAILVNMALDGRREAFDELVRKHRSRVLSTARALVGTADGAEDVAQQAFVAAFANLRLLKDPSSFRPWLMTITRRCATRQWTAHSRETVGLDDVVLAFPCHRPIDDSEVRARIAETLAELSALNRKIVVLHYLDGFSCREIGESLGMPSGTVKRILHESRSSLRASSELARGVGEMAQNNQGPRTMRWWVSGEWPGGVMDGVLKQSICLTINKTGLTPEQIAKRVDANEIYVREALDALEAEELVEKVGRGRYRNTFIALGAEDWIALSRQISAKCERMADVIAEALPELQSAWNNSPKPEQGFDWKVGVWPLLAIPVRHFARIRNGATYIWPEPPVHPVSGKRYWGGGAELVAFEQMLWDMTFSLSLQGPLFAGFHCAHFWSHAIPFTKFRGLGSHDQLHVLGAVATGLRDVGSIARAVPMDVEKAQEAVAQAIEMGQLGRAQGGLAVKIPVFTTEDDAAMLGTVDRVGARLAEVADSLPAIRDAMLRDLGFSYLEEQFPACHNFQVAAAGDSIRVLYNRGLLPHPGDPAPASFCMAGWFETSQLCSGK